MSKEIDEFINELKRYIQTIRDDSKVQIDSPEWELAVKLSIAIRNYEGRQRA